MVEELIPNTLTVVHPPDLYTALRVAWPSGSRASALVLLSQWAFETGRGKACHCYNIGNIKHVPGDGHDFTQFRCNEIIGGKMVWFDPPNPATSFRAYETLALGVADYLRVLQKTFASAWPAVLAGDPAAFAVSLHNAHYYTADPSVYSRNLVSLFREFDHTMPPDPDPGEGDGDPSPDNAA
jgi:flagellum-specific peptidoglycan hydrolase FlgJ